MTNWQPISTAPQDGREIIVCNYTKVTFAYWDFNAWVVPCTGSKEVYFEPLFWAGKPNGFSNDLEAYF